MRQAQPSGGAIAYFNTLEKSSGNGANWATSAAAQIEKGLGAICGQASLVVLFLLSATSIMQKRLSVGKYALFLVKPRGNQHSRRHHQSWSSDQKEDNLVRVCGCHGVFLCGQVKSS